MSTPHAFVHLGYVPYLLRRISDLLSDRLSAGLACYDLTIPMWRIIAVLHGRGGTRFSVLASQTQIEPSTMSRLINELRKHGYVNRTSSSVDGRGVLIAPTPKALALVEEITPIAFEVEEEALAGPTEDEAEIFRRLLKRVCAHLAPFAPDEEGRD